MPLLQKAYLGATPLFRDNPWYASAGDPEDGSATVTADASANTKGAWAEIIASTSANASVMFVFVRGLGSNGVDTAALLDIGTGASGSESVAVGDIGVGSHGFGFGAAATGEPPTIVIPFKVPSGTRISARIQCATASRSCNVLIAVADYGDFATAPTSVDVIGGNTANSQAVGLATSGTWTEVTVSTARAYRAVVMVPSMSATARASSLNGTYNVGVGASGGEIEFGDQNLRFNTSEQCLQFHPNLSLFGRAIAAGSRLAVRQNVTTSNPAELQVTLIGIP